MGLSIGIPYSSFHELRCNIATLSGAKLVKLKEMSPGIEALVGVKYATKTNVWDKEPTDPDLAFLLSLRDFEDNIPYERAGKIAEKLKELYAKLKKGNQNSAMVLIEALEDSYRNKKDLFIG